MEKNSFPSLIASFSNDYLADFQAYEVSAEVLFTYFLNETHKAILNSNLDCLRKQCKLFKYIIAAKAKHNLQLCFNSPSNPIRFTNIIILACKYNKREVLEFVFSSPGKTLYLLPSLISLAGVRPVDKDDNNHNAFYYSIRSGNCSLLETLAHKWPGGMKKKEMDDILSLAYRELKLKHVSLSPEMETSVARLLIDLRFVSDPSIEVKQITLKDIKDRLSLVFECIGKLIEQYLDKNIDEEFVFVTKFIAQNIFILKAGLRSTYAVIPWEEMYFYLIAFISWITKSNHINVFSPTLVKSNMLKHLSNFGICLKSETDRIKNLEKLFILPRRKPKAIMKSILSKYPFLQNLYHDFTQIRDIYSLKVIGNYIDLSLSIDCDVKDKHLVIARSLQVIGENLKDSVESPRLSQDTSDLLMLSLSGWTKQIISETRDALSHTNALSVRFELERKYDDEFFIKILNDFRKLKAVTASLLFIKKIEIFKEVFQKVVDGENDSEMEEILNNFFVIKWDDIVTTNHIFKNLEEVKCLVEQISSMIEKKTIHEIKLFEEVQKILDNEIYNADLSKYSYFKSDIKIQAIKQYYMFSLKMSDFPLKKIAENVLISMSENKNSLKISDILKELISVVVKRINHEEGLKLLFNLTNAILFKMPNVECMQELRDTLTKIGSSDQQPMPSSVDSQVKLEDQMIHEKLNNLKDEIKESESINPSQKNSIFLKNDKVKKAVIEMHLLDILNVTLARKRLNRNICFLDNESPLLIGKNLRDHLAHGNILDDLLFFDTHNIVELNLRKFILEDVFQTGLLIDQRLNRDISALRENFNRDLSIISNQKELFKALEMSNLSDAQYFIRKGADIRAKDVFIGNAFHFAAQKSCLQMLYFIAMHNAEFDCRDVSGKSPLHIAAEHDRQEIVEFLVQNGGIQIDGTDCQGQTALHIAAKFGHSKIVNILMQHGAQTDILDVYNGFPLHYAAVNNHLSTFKLIEMKESVSKADFIHTATWAGSTDIVKYLLEKGVNVDDENFLRQSPLHVAARSGREDIATLLINEGANINARSISECTPLITAALFGKEKIVHILLQAGADFTASDVGDKQPLHCASEQGHVNIVKLLLQYKAPVNLKTIAGKTPLIMASEKGHKDIVENLLESGADVNESTKLKETALHLSTYFGHYETVYLLLNNGANINSKETQGFTPLHFAVYKNRKDIVELFLKICKTTLIIDAENDEKETALFIAASIGYSDGFEMLIEVGANTYHKDIKNSSLIHRCAVGGNSELIKYLINKGADVNVLNDDGNTPLHYAVLFDNLDAAKTLIANKAHLNIENKEYVTPLYLAVKRNNLDILQFLISKNENIDVYGQLIALAVKEGYIDAFTILLKIKNVNINSLVHAGEELINRLSQENNLLLVNEQSIDALINEKFSALYIAAIHGNAGIIKLIIKKGANVNFQTPVLKETPLIIASEFGHHKIVKILLRANAETNITDATGQTAIHHASERGHIKIVKKLLKNKADINIKDRHKRTPLLCAISKNHLSIVKLILSQKDVELDSGIFEFKREYPSISDAVLFSVIAGHQRIVELFLENYSKKNLASFSSLLLEIAIVGGSVEVVNYLIELGANVNAPFKTECHQKPLHFAAYHDNENIVAILLANGAYYDDDDEYGNKSWEGQKNKARKKLALTENLHIAVKNNDLKMVKKNIDEGAFLDAKNVEEVTPLFNAVWKDHYEIVETLLKYNANPNCRNKNGFTPLHLAAFYGKNKSTISLLANGAVYNALSNRGNTPLAFSQNNDISFLLNLIENSFNDVRENNFRVIHVLKDLKDIQIIKALMKCLNREHRTLVTEAIFYNFKNALQLEEIHLKHLFIFRKWAKQLFLAGKYGQALNILQLIQEECQDILGNNTQNWLSIQQNIGFLLHKQQKNKSALVIFQDIYTKRKQLHGENNFSTLHAKALISVVLYYLECYEESLDSLNFVYSQQKKNLIEDSEYLFFYQRYIVLGMIKLRMISDASIICNPLFDSSKEIFGEYCPLTLSIQEVFASLLCSEKKYDLAFQVYNDVCKKREKILGPYHIDTLRSYRDIANLFCDLRNVEAINIYLQILLPQLDIFGKNHLETLLTVYGMANCYDSNDDHSKAYGAYCYILPKLQEIIDETHPVIKDVLKKIKKIEVYFESTYAELGKEVGRRSFEVYDVFFKTNVMNWFIPRTFFNEQVLFNSNSNQLRDKVSRNENVYL